MRLAAKTTIPPPLSDDAAWHAIIAAETINAFTPEQIVELYDTRSDTHSKVVVGYIEDYLTTRILERLRRFGLENELTYEGECKAKALLIIIEALKDPTHARFNGLRLYFHNTIRYIFEDVLRTVAKNFRNYPRSSKITPKEFEALDDEEKGPPLEDRFDSHEDELIREIDRDEAMRMLESAFVTTKHLKDIYDLTLDKKTQLEIAAHTRLSERHVRRLQTKIVQILSEPDME